MLPGDLPTVAPVGTRGGKVVKMKFFMSSADRGFRGEAHLSSHAATAAHISSGWIVYLPDRAMFTPVQPPGSEQGLPPERGVLGSFRDFPLNQLAAGEICKNGTSVRAPRDGL